MVLVKYASRCDVLVYEHLTDPEVATPCGERSNEYAEWPTCRNCHDHVCLNHRMQNTFEDDEGRETVLCRDCYWQTVREKDRRAGAKLVSGDLDIQKAASDLIPGIAAAKVGGKPAGRCGNYAGHEYCSDPLGCSKPSGHEGNCG